MISKINIIPYSETWINCYANDNLSILSSRESSYKLLGLYNLYGYSVIGSTEWWRIIELNYTSEFYKKINLVNRSKMTIKLEDVAFYIKNAINNGEIISVQLDTFHAIKSGVNYKRAHYLHHYIITGYDEIDNFYCLADTINGYGENVLTYSDIVSSMARNCSNNIISFAINKPLVKLDFDIHIVINNAVRLRFELSKLSYCKYWQYDMNMMQDRIIEINKIVSRHHMNITLFEYLRNTGYLNNKNYNYLKSYCVRIYEKWNRIKMILIRNFLIEKMPDLTLLNSIAYDAFYNEYKLWDAFLTIKEEETC